LRQVDVVEMCSVIVSAAKDLMPLAGGDEVLCCVQDHIIRLAVSAQAGRTL
jgi:hypothetical protein